MIKSQSLHRVIDSLCNKRIHVYRAMEICNSFHQSVIVCISRVSKTSIIPHLRRAVIGMYAI
jgi:hypothetical protein